ncbi:hypothetical protein RHABOEDO_000595 [Candidatus Rhabdochlamydia oedothoracis]|uniref:Transposase n=1 Tax=Candidatus Rhabdochlamydia oedothoracis TaxID=2720720 RepID=A0ABX8UZP0_9BACT|nr:helix-turn-helix domain-containing protein [Candidatus Rhabdochlamydia oedothoracis]QYF48434.1 hypothetical protein RHABOEDO_000595 [Candidatus Rhabdochlamydia oedothoracis]
MKGWTYPQVAHALLLDEDTIRRCYKTYLEGGKEALLNLNYAGKACRLNQGQLKQLKIYVKEEAPSSAKQVVNFAKDHFGICYTPSAMVSLLQQITLNLHLHKLFPLEIVTQVLGAVIVVVLGMLIIIPLGLC